MNRPGLSQKTPLKYLVLFFLLASFFVYGQAVLAQGSYNFADNSGLGHSADVAGFETGPGALQVDSIIGRVIFVGLGLVGVIFFALTLLAGFKWMISQGNEEKVGQAKDSLLNSIVGLIITLAAYAISYFLINYFG